MVRASAKLAGSEAIWMLYCSEVDGLIDAYARRLSAMQRRFSMDEPCRSFSWHDGETGCSLSFLLCAPPVEQGEPEYRLAVWAAAYRDDGEQLTRRLWELPEPYLLMVPVSPETLTPVLERAIAFLATAPAADPPSREVPICGLPG